MSNIVQDKLIDYAMFKDGVEKLGTVDVDLPDIEYMEETIKGAGINGEVGMPTLGMVGKLPLKVTWRTITGDVASLGAPIAHNLEIMGAQQGYDSGLGKIVTKQVRVSVRALPKKMGLGKFGVAATTGTTSDMECVYFKLQVDGKTEIEIDKFARVCYIGGTDYFEEVRSALGL